MADPREHLAELCHDQWTHWMKYLFSVQPLNEDGSFTIPPAFVVRWKSQMDTPYSQLTEKEQNSDREQADKFLKVINNNE